MFSLLGTLIVGLIVGLIARAIKPGDDSLGWMMTILLGIAGAFLASYIGVAMGWYQQGDAAGWIRIGPRTKQARIPRTRMIAAASTEPFDDASVWAVTCFVVRREHRGEGLNHALLDAAVDYARSSGARLIEGYPVDTGGEKQRTNDLFHGTLGTFLAAGFETQAEMKPGRTLVALALGN